MIKYEHMFIIQRKGCDKYMEKIKIDTEYIKLDQFLKWTGIVDKGSDAKIMIAEGNINVNGQKELKRGRKLRKGDTVEIGEKVFVIE